MSSRLADYARKAVKVKPEWTRPTTDDFAKGCLVISFDQSLSTTGVVVLQVTDVIEILDRTTLRTKPSIHHTIPETLFLQQLALSNQAKNFTAAMVRYPDAIVLERPAIQGFRTESSLLAAAALYGPYGAKTPPVALVSIQHSRAVLCGPQGRDDKRLGHEGLAHLIPDSSTRSWNGHQRDAALNGLAYLWDLKAKEAVNV